jgi:hypothetical protein
MENAVEQSSEKPSDKPFGVLLEELRTTKTRRVAIKELFQRNNNIDSTLTPPADEVVVIYDLGNHFEVIKTNVDELPKRIRECGLSAEIEASSNGSKVLKVENSKGSEETIKIIEKAALGLYSHSIFIPKNGEEVSTHFLGEIIPKESTENLEEQSISLHRLRGIILGDIFRSNIDLIGKPRRAEIRLIYEEMSSGLARGRSLAALMKDGTHLKTKVPTLGVIFDIGSDSFTIEYNSKTWTPIKILPTRTREGRGLLGRLYDNVQYYGVRGITSWELFKGGDEEAIDSTNRDLATLLSAYLSNRSHAVPTLVSLEIIKECVRGYEWNGTPVWETLQVPNESEATTPKNISVSIPKKEEVEYGIEAEYGVEGFEEEFKKLNAASVQSEISPEVTAEINTSAAVILSTTLLTIGIGIGILISKLSTRKK